MVALVELIRPQLFAMGNAKATGVEDDSSSNPLRPKEDLNRVLEQSDLNIPT